MIGSGKQFSGAFTLCILVLCGAAIAGAETITWTGNTGNGKWETAGNWDLGRTPGDGDDVVIPDLENTTLVTYSTGSTSIESITSDESFAISGGTLAIQADSHLNSTFAFSGGRLNGPGTITVAGVFDWSNGTLEGGGHTIAQGGINASGGSLYNHTLDNVGTLVWTGDSYGTGNGGVFNNLDGATFDIQVNRSWIFQGGAPVTFNNAGTLKKSAGTGTAAIEMHFNNSNVVEVNDNCGTLRFDVGDGTHTGSFQIGAGSALGLNAATHTFNGPISGAGSFFVNAGTVNINESYDTGATAVTGGTVNINGSYDTGPTTVTGGTLALNAAWQTDAVSISGGTFSFVEDGQIDTLAMSGGKLTTAATLTVTGVFDWSDGILEGGGHTIAQGGINASGGSLYNHTLDNVGTLVWTGNSYGTGNGGVFNNLEGATFDIRANQTWIYQGGAPVTFNNAGTLKKSAGTGTAAIQMHFNNSNVVEVNDNCGTLRFNVGDGTHSGTFQIGADSALDFSAATHTLNGPISGAGKIFVHAGTVNVNGSYDTGPTTVTNGTLALNSAWQTDAVSISGGSFSFVEDGQIDTLAMSGGKLTTAATLTVTGVFDWSNGTLEGGGHTIAQGGINASGGSLYNHTLDNVGTLVWTGNSYGTGNGGVFNNLEGATFDIRVNQTWVYQGGAPVTFNNAGTLKKSAGTGTSAIQMHFNNSNLVEVNDNCGTLRFDVGDGTHTGSFQIGAGSALGFSAATHTFDGPISGTGSFFVNVGTVHVNGSYDTGATTVTGGTVQVNGSYDTGPTTVTNGTLALNAAWQADAVSISGGTFSFVENGQIDTLAMSGGKLTTAATLTVTGVFDWSEGILEGGGHTIAQGGINASGGSLYNHTLDNVGTLVWTGNSYGTGNGGVFNNLEGATFDIRVNQTWVYQGGAPVTFNNAGTLKKSAGTGTSKLQLDFKNTGTVNLLVGTVSATAIRQTAGEIVLDGGNLDTTGSTLDLQGGLLRGNGTITGHVANSGGTVAPGVSPGELTISGNYTQSVGGALSIELGGYTGGSEFDRLVVSGTATLDGALNSDTVNNFVPDGGDKFRFLDAGTRKGEFTVINSNCKLGPVRVEYGDTSATLVIIASSRGDLNCDCAIDFDDIDAFVAALVGRDQFEQQYPDCDFNRGDINCDGSVDFDDIDSFVNCIIIGECDACP